MRELQKTQEMVCYLQEQLEEAMTTPPPAQTTPSVAQATPPPSEELNRAQEELEMREREIQVCESFMIFFIQNHSLKMAVC